MDYDFTPLIILVVFLAIFGGLVYLATTADQQFEATLSTTYADCVTKKESEYTCKTYVQSMRTERAAQEAAENAALAAGMAAANIGSK